ncbi:MAG: type II secretion system protein M [Fretibacterium sp.]|nr:type II secretion system protein M [Fretibacterium sp.]
MVFNFDAGLNHARAVLRGEVTGSVRFLAFLVAALAVWVGASYFSTLHEDASSDLVTQKGHYRALQALVEEHRASGSDSGQAVDVPTVFAQVSERLALGTRVNRMTPDGKNHSIEVNRLYAEELVELVRELALRGVRLFSAEVRALPAGNDRLFTVSAIIGIGQK